MRLNKFLSDAGVCSRREADRAIEVGKVTINGRRAPVGSQVKPRDTVRYNGNLIENLTTEEKYHYIALNKPVGITSTSEKSDPSNVIKFIGFPTRIFHVGRLDKDSEGLLLLTNNGDVVNKVLRSENNHQKEYEVWVDRPLSGEFIERMAGGVEILGTRTRKCEVEMLTPNMFRIVLTQGLNRQIRRMCEALGYEVTRLRRIRVMNVELGKLEVGGWRMIEDEELEEFLASLEESSAETSIKAGSPKKRFSRKPFPAKPFAKSFDKTKSDSQGKDSKPSKSSSITKSSAKAKPTAKTAAKPTAKARPTKGEGASRGPASRGASKTLSKFAQYRSKKK